MNPKDQLQVGDQVLFTEHGIVTEVVGYRWLESFGRLPELMGYQLSCGVTVPYSALAKITDGKVQLDDLDRTVRRED